MARITLWVANHQNQLVRLISLSPAWFWTCPLNWWSTRPACPSDGLHRSNYFTISRWSLKYCDIWLIKFDELWPLSNEFISRVYHQYYKLELNALIVASALIWLIVASAFGQFCPRSRYRVLNKGNRDIKMIRMIIELEKWRLTKKFFKISLHFRKIGCRKIFSIFFIGSKETSWNFRGTFGGQI